MKTKILHLFFVMSLSMMSIFSQPTEVWVARYDGGSTDQLYATTVDADGNVYATGASIQIPFTSDYLTVKYNSSGVKLWEKAYNGKDGSDDRAYAIAVVDSGYVYVTGGTAYNNSVVTIKYNSLGDTVWTRYFIGPMSGNNWTFMKSIVVDDSGYVYIAGSSEGLVALHGYRQDYTIVKYSPAGVQKWVARYNGPGTDADWVNSMTVDALGNVYVTGTAGGGSTGSLDPFNDITTIKYNAAGIPIWTKTYAGVGTSWDEGNMIKLDNLGNVYITGITKTDAIALEDIITIKYNSSGTELWTKIYNGIGSFTDEGNALVIDANHSIYVAGKSYTSSINGYDMITLKYDSVGTLLWGNIFNGTASLNEFATAATLDLAGNVYVLGTTDNITTGHDYQLIKYNSLGIQQWEQKYTYLNAAGSQEEAVSVFVDNLNNVYSGGSSALDFAIVKYTQPIGLQEAVRPLVCEVFPNPSTGSLSIKNIESALPISLDIYDILGRNVYKVEITNSNLELDLSKLLNGIYFLSFSNSENFFATKTVIKQ